MPSPETVTVHPLVLLSVVDHYNRVAKDTKKRVVGVLLGSVSKGEVDVTNSFAVPFEEDTHDPKIWFMDHSYMETMSTMFRKVNARETIIGWYSTGPKLRPADLDINELMCKYCTDPVLLICQIKPRDVGLPVNAYVAREQVKPEGTEKAQQVFVHLPTAVSQTEAEEIGVEHLLRDVKDATISTLSTDIVSQAQALKGLQRRLAEMHDYLEAVAAGRLPVNRDIIALMQDIFNLLPNLNMTRLSEALTVQGNDMTMSVYLASIMRAVVSLHELIENKEARVWAEKQKQAAEAEKAAAKAGKPDKGSEGKENQAGNQEGAEAPSSDAAKKS